MRDQSTIAAPTARGPLRAVTGLLRWFDRTPRLLLLGFVVSVLGTFELSRVKPAPWTLMGTRADGLTNSLEVLRDGGPILTVVNPADGSLLPVGGGDDQGLYLIVPWLAHTLGWDDPINLLRWIALLALAVTIAIYPWLIRRLTGSVLVALASPLVLLIAFWRMPLGDIYWVGMWVTLTLVPILLLIDRRWPRHGLALLLGILVVASLASSIRSQAGLPVLIGATLVLVRRPWSRWEKSGALVLCIVAYISVTSFGMLAAREVRDRQLDGRVLASEVGHSHPFWHSTYIGLGYIPNDWDIRYFDSIGYRDVLREDPKARFLGPAYNRILRERYFSLLAEHPWYAFRLYGAKLFGALSPGWVLLIVLAVLSPWLLLVDRRRSRWRRDGLFIALAAVIGIASPLIATPYSAYLLSWLGAVLLAAILAVGATLSDWSSAVAYARSLGRGPSARECRQPLVVGATFASLVVALAVVVVAPGIERTAADWNAKPPPPVYQPADATH
jgi:hypothetical protein